VKKFLPKRDIFSSLAFIKNSFPCYEFLWAMCRASQMYLSNKVKPRISPLFLYIWVIKPKMNAEIKVDFEAPDD